MISAEGLKLLAQSGAEDHGRHLGRSARTSAVRGGAGLRGPRGGLRPCRARRPRFPRRRHEGSPAGSRGGGAAVQGHGAWPGGLRDAAHCPRASVLPLHVGTRDSGVTRALHACRGVCVCQCGALAKNSFRDQACSCLRPTALPREGAGGSERHLEAAGPLELCAQPRGRGEGRGPGQVGTSVPCAREPRARPLAAGAPDLPSASSPLPFLPAAVCPAPSTGEKPVAFTASRRRPNASRLRSPVL